ncbi:MAG: hypothetical protein GY835_11705 [bacterium]|nr:hypothetical protein [bacterium]
MTGRWASSVEGVGRRHHFGSIVCIVALLFICCWWLIAASIWLIINLSINSGIAGSPVTPQCASIRLTKRCNFWFCPIRSIADGAVCRILLRIGGGNITTQQQQQFITNGSSPRGIEISLEAKREDLKNYVTFCMGEVAMKKMSDEVRGHRRFE